MAKTKLNINGSKVLSTSLIGTGIMMLVSMLIVVVIAFCISNEYLELPDAGYMVISGQFISVFTGVFITAKMARGENKQIACYVGTLLYYFLLVCTGMLFFEMQFTYLIRSAIVHIAASVLAVILENRRKMNGSNKKRRRGYR